MIEAYLEGRILSTILVHEGRRPTIEAVSNHRPRRQLKMFSNLVFSRVLLSLQNHN